MSGIAHAFYLFAGVISALLGMAKFNGGFFGRWEIVLSPITFSLAIGSLLGLWSLYTNRTKKVILDGIVSPYMIYHLEKRYSYGIGIATIEPLLGIAISLQLGEFFNRLESKKEEHPDADMLGLTVVFALIVSLVYRLRREAHQKSIEKINYEGEDSYLAWKKDTKYPVIGILLNQFFNLLGATTMVCAGGACNSLYISTITLFFSSLGISLTDWVPYLNGMGFGFIIFALFSLYSAKKDLLYPPFIIGCLCSIVILISLTKIYYNLYLLILANIGMVVCAIMNFKMNTASMFPSRAKKLKHTPLPI